MININNINPEKPVLIVGPTASGKTSLAIAIAQAQGRVVVNADALQVYDGWRVLTARPTPEEEDAVPHHLYGHVPFTAHYDVGQWLQDLTPFLAQNPVIVGGTGLYFRALTQGLADIPAIPPDIRAEADARSHTQRLADLHEGDPALVARIDCDNPMRVQRGWEVLRATGRPLSAWQDETPPPLLPLGNTTPLALMPDRDWLNARIAQRFDQMLNEGALDEARANLPRWSSAGGAAKAIGAPELIAHLHGTLPLAAARDAAVTATRQYAKRQRSWQRSNTQAWQSVPLP
ncbi:tRNA (adenosine(37)-N6)-dimethylallyltransferase MiaA [Jannaschia sp. CCS1]|uniref:tRNA dimethylallyltransferase n=1 Tax=Jannaschia sp. (strain CCS1) TaxID=290400 RepID=MIAA_JANSC|nr:tRNA (adenosine(37)-N6)-dimethylallyltransferase MiaA [Jannaschia sp. CCS1]Q28PI4.1 RecName: Full=tRNA dimethylallyltransferase; AltName: Full=Dimethylallyl diphosphate:tRNA dimethylallyltransferase; Short=DMAPP:tRNA dimethylallyltransferase; Short=DMATase; AltName: Full=Isopentenyl-diphosphate:tRNA isopentenyltransferase; Short=IPP transferase; Short=IPPT; Short=IPTase [Jannaschia sp. CCS1]ABD55378.1 tRNA delta(2)-isopentenylpyrophosphate transferase [Jannaschia sp. CCS1]